MINELKDVDGRECLRLLYSAAVYNQFPTAIWRLPNSMQQNAIVDLSGAPGKVSINLENITSGFMITPFARQSERTSYLIRSDIHWNGATFDFFSEQSHTNGVHEAKNRSRFVRTVKGLLDSGLPRNEAAGPDLPRTWFEATAFQSDFLVDDEVFLDWVRNAIRRIKNSDLRKIVLSRTVKSRLSQDFHPLRLFHHLCEAYSNAFVSLVAIPGVGTWIGATPELLLQLQDDHLRTVALAGTQQVTSKPVWRQKELQEQAIVSDYVRECFSRLEVEDYTESGPETMQIGKLLHLITKFDLKLDSSQPRRLASNLLRLLHPTPAVCGVPKEQASRLIQKIETHDREFYSGFLGPVNFAGASHLFVNLRCLQLLDTAAILYAGSGITEDSVAEQECLETELKLRALSSILDKTSALRSRETFIEKGVLVEQGVA